MLGRRAFYLGAKSINFADLLGVAYRLSGRDAKVAITIEPLDADQVRHQDCRKESRITQEKALLQFSRVNYRA